jgi:hypothetical protein
MPANRLDPDRLVHATTQVYHTGRGLIRARPCPRTSAGCWVTPADETIVVCCTRLLYLPSQHWGRRTPHVSTRSAELDEHPSRGRKLARATPDQRDRQADSGSQAPHCQGRARQRGQRAGQDRNAEALGGERTSRNGSPLSRARCSGCPAAANTWSRAKVMADPRRGPTST